MPISAAAVQRTEHWADRLLGTSATKRCAIITGESAEILREGSLGFLRILRDAAFSVMQSSVVSPRSEGNKRFALAEDALQVIEAGPVQQPPSVEILATALCTTRRTLLNVFQETFGTSPSRYILAKRLNEARRDLGCGKSHTVTDAALDYGFEHFGRFACQYRDLFGETPSTTLQRAKMFRRDALG